MILSIRSYLIKTHLFNIKLFGGGLGHLANQRGVLLKVQVNNNLKSELVAVLFKLLIRFIL
jgi:hypothetical protein